MQIKKIYNNLKIELITYHKNRQGVNNSHFYHILLPSKWPILMSLALFMLALSFVITVNLANTMIFIFSNLNVIMGSFLVELYFWAFDMINAGGEHTNLVRRGIKISMTLFIMSEVIFFWTYFYSSVNPSIEIGHVWPAVGQVEHLINSIQLPFLNTLLLLSSGICITLVHKITAIFFKFKEVIIN